MAEKDSANASSYEFTYSYLPGITTCTLGALLNVLLLVAFIKDPLKCFRNSGTYLLMSLSVSDCLTCSFTVFHFSSNSGDVGSRLVFNSLSFWFTATSVLSIAAISIDRYLMVAYPIKYRILVGGKVIALWVTAVWITGALMPLFTLFLKTKIYGFYLSFFIAVSAIMYSITYYNLKKQSRNMASRNSSEGRAQEIRIMKEKRFLNTIVIIAVIVFVCVLPTAVVLQTNSFVSEIYVNNNFLTLVKEISLFIFSINFAANPIIYVLRLPNYRKTFYLLYWRR